MIKGKLKNGIKYIIKNCKSSVSIIIFFKVGSRNEHEKYFGISHVIEHLMFKGTKNRKTHQSIVEPLYRYGAQVNAFTDKDNTGYFVKIESQYIDEALKILSDMIFNSLFLEKDLENEKKIIVNELERNLSDPEKLIHFMNDKLLYCDTLLEHEIGGDKNSVMNLTHDMIMSYLLNFYIKENMLISIAGNVDKNIVKKLNKYFGNQEFHYQPKNNLIQNNQLILYPCLKYIQNNIRYNNIIRSDLKQAYVIISVPTYNINDDKSYIVDIIGTILAGNMSSRLFLKLREKCGLVYSVRRDVDKYEDCGALKIIFSTSNTDEKIKMCCIEVVKEFNKLKEEKVDKKELQYSKDYLIGTLNLSQEDTQNVASFIGQKELFMKKPLTYKEFIQKYKKITSDDIYHVSNDIFNINKLNISIISKNKIF